MDGNAAMGSPNSTALNTANHSVDMPKADFQLSTKAAFFKNNQRQLQNYSYTKHPRRSLKFVHQMPERGSSDMGNKPKINA